MRISQELVDMFRQYHAGEIIIILEVYHVSDPETVIRAVKIENGPPALPMVNPFTGETIHDPDQLRYEFKAVKRGCYE